MSKQKQGILNRHRTARLSRTKRTNISERSIFLFLSHLCLCYFCLTMALLSVLVLGLRLWQVLYIFYFRKLLSLYYGLSVKSFWPFKQWPEVHNKGIRTITVTKNRERTHLKLCYLIFIKILSKLNVVFILLKIIVKLFHVVHHGCVPLKTELRNLC